MTSIITISLFETSFGELILGDYQNQLCVCNWSHKKTREQVDNRIQRYLKASYREGDSDLLSYTKDYLRAYESGDLQAYDQPVLLAGTAFQKSVWQVLSDIPRGDTLSYQEVANQINRPKSVRAVANAIGANAMSIIVPCHRVIGSSGALTGYAGGIEAKKRLLELEAVR